MPELPEVETVRRGLIKKIKGKTIKDINILYDGIIAYPEKAKFIEILRNKTIKDIERLGKFLLIDLDDYYLISHLRMEGKYFIKDVNSPLTKHDHVVLIFDDDKELVYNDTRKFGKMYLYKKDDLSNSPISKLGKEPWDTTLDEKYLKEKLNKNIAIKTLLLDQSIITGIGNIYADEILFKSNINPCIKGCNLRKKDLSNIIKYTRSILEEAILKGGTTIHTYKSVDGITGLFQQSLLVHGKKDEGCPVCNTKILKVSVNGRGTYYCPKCQK